MSLPKSFPLKAADGKTIDMPSVGYGTWSSYEKGWAKKATLDALKAGYRHLDCAWMYGVDHEIGEAIRESGIPREEIFVTTKFWPHFAAPENVEFCLDLCLERLGLDYVDQFLAHMPYASKPISREALKNAKTGPGTSNTERGILTGEDGKPVIDWEHTSTNIAKAKGYEGSFIPTWEAMKALVRKNKTRTIGVSNFTITEISDILSHAKDIPISCNQVEVHPWLPQTALVDFCKSHDILVTAYSPFAGQKKSGDKLIEDPTVKELAKKNNLGEGQLLQSWAVQRGTVPLGKSSSPERIASNLAVTKLSSEDFEKLNALEKKGDEGRTIDFSEAFGVPLFTN